MTLEFRRIASVFCLICIAACSSEALFEGGAGGSAAGGGSSKESPWAMPFGGSRECYSTNSNCAHNYSDCFDRCWESAVFDPGYPCADVCRDAWPCLGSTGNNCAIYTYKFAGGAKVPELESSCQAAADRYSRCGMNGLGSCEAASRVESDQVGAAYECIAGTACGDSPAKCDPAPDYALADQICDTVERSCRTTGCGDGARDVLAYLLPWLRADAVAAAKECLVQDSCRNIEECLKAWNRVASSSMPDPFWTFLGYTGG